eukprot:2801840-Prorocentrum_lima.AAC.1
MEAAGLLEVVAKGLAEASCSNHRVCLMIAALAREILRGGSNNTKAVAVGKGEKPKKDVDPAVTED